ncbi:MAG: nicotinate phosphoribosyltransferase [Candidatus Marinimicrobia bacterium]|nr:nicotinate phosphoribosyltransferase [Candidatus Neomarinimicrobiota bacterium]
MINERHITKEDIISMHKPSLISAAYTDLYELTMAQAYFLGGHKDTTAVFDYFFRKLPFNGGYVVFAGLWTLLEILEDLRFTPEDIEYLREWGFDKTFLKYLGDFRFRGSVDSSAEGDIVFPTRPVLSIEGSVIEAQIIETLVLNVLNFQSLIATKASRMRQSAGERKLIDFGMRRAHGPSAYYAARAAVIGGFDATSNVQAGKDLGIPVSGTMAHSYVQYFDDELSAFRSFAEHWPENCILLADTYNTLESGVPNAITVAREMKERGQELKGIRLDSGDLAYMAKRSRKMLDDSGLKDVKIAASNQLDEHLIKSLLEQHAPIDVFGVGTNLVTGQPDAALDGVYKLAFSNGKAKMKLSENISKITIPHKKQVHRLRDKQGKILGADIISLRDDNDLSKMYHPLNPAKSMSFKNYKSESLLHPFMKNGSRLSETPSLSSISAYRAERLAELPDEYKRFDNPHIYKIGLSRKLKEKRDAMINYYQEKE